MSNKIELTAAFVCASLYHCESIPEKMEFFNAFKENFYKAPDLLDAKLARRLAQEIIRTRSKEYRDLLIEIVPLFLTREIPTYEETAPALLEETNRVPNDKNCHFSEERQAAYLVMNLGCDLCVECLPENYPLNLLKETLLADGEYTTIQKSIQKYIKAARRIDDKLVGELLRETLSRKNDAEKDAALETLCLGLTKNKESISRTIMTCEDALSGSTEEVVQGLRVLKGIAEKTSGIGGSETLRALHALATKDIGSLQIPLYEIVTLVVEKNPELAKDALDLVARFPKKNLHKDIATERKTALQKIAEADITLLPRMAPNTAMAKCTSLLLSLKK